MDPKTQTTTAVELLTTLVEHTTVDQLANATPCAGWTVRDLLNHVLGGGVMFTLGLRGTPIDIPEEPVDLVGADHVASYRSIIDAFSRALAATDDLAQMVTLPFGTMPADVALRLAAGDLLVHGWDLATATGQSFVPPTDFIDAVEGFYRMAVTDDMRAAGMFDAPVDPPAGAAPIERLAAFAGRALVEV